MENQTGLDIRPPLSCSIALRSDPRIIVFPSLGLIRRPQNPTIVAQYEEIQQCWRLLRVVRRRRRGVRIVRGGRCVPQLRPVLAIVRQNSWRLVIHALIESSKTWLEPSSSWNMLGFTGESLKSGLQETAS